MISLTIQWNSGRTTLLTVYLLTVPGKLEWVQLRRFRSLDVNGSLRLNGSRLFLGAVGGINSGYTGIYETSSDLKLAVFATGAPANLPFASANSIDAITIKIIQAMLELALEHQQNYYMYITVVP